MWKEIIPRTIKTFQYDDEPELMHIITTGFNDVYIAVFEDAYSQTIERAFVGNKSKMEEMFKIKL